MQTASDRLQIELVPVESLIPYARNARTHSDTQIAQLAASIKEFGFNNPILVDGEKGIIAGHGRLEAARKLGLSQVPVIELKHLNENQKRAFIIADNKLALNAGWNDELLALELACLKDENFDLDVIGFDQKELNQLLDEGKIGLTDDDEVPEAPEKPISKSGDVWILGNHRLMCGDSTVITDVQKLMNNQLADMVFTDPPYNVAYEGYAEQDEKGKSIERMKIKNDQMSLDEFAEFLSSAWKSYVVATKKSASLYVCHASSCQREFQDTLEKTGFSVRCQIIWAKNTFAWGHGRYKFQHEPIFYCHRSGESDVWYGDKSQATLWKTSFEDRVQTTLWEEKKPAANRLHPTMKPVELVARALKNSSKSDDIVLDLFGGSGSTLIASEKFGRRSYVMELDPKFADVIIERWQSYTGQEAILEGTKKTYATLKAAHNG